MQVWKEVLWELEGGLGQAAGRVIIRTPALPSLLWHCLQLCLWLPMLSFRHMDTVDAEPEGSSVSNNRYWARKEGLYSIGQAPEGD